MTRIYNVAAKLTQRFLEDGDCISVETLSGHWNEQKKNTQSSENDDDITNDAINVSLLNVRSPYTRKSVYSRAVFIANMRVLYFQR